MHEDGYGTLASILAATSIYPESHVPCYQWKPNYKIITKAKRHNEQKNIKGGSRTSATSKKEYFVTLVNS